MQLRVIKHSYFSCATLFKNNLSEASKLSTIMSTKRGHSSSASEDKTAKKMKTSGHWSLGLLDSMQDPENVVQTDDLVVTIRDKYPKAQFHYLVMPKENISSLRSITDEHRDLLKHMEEVGDKIAENEKHKGKKFNLGYHAEASMFRLHLHVISDDMNSECLKTKKHWNSFTTGFFLHSKEVRKQLETNGKVSLPSNETCKKLLNTPLKCHKCHYAPKNIPDLKRHIISHIK